MSARSLPPVVRGSLAALRRAVRTALRLLPVSVVAVAGLAWPALAVGPAPTPSPPAGVSQPVSTFGVAPANDSKIDGRPAFYYSASPGARLTDHVAFVNAGTTPVDLTIYASGAVATTTGEFALAAANRKAEGVGSWIQVLPPSVPLTIPARTDAGPSIVVVPLTLQVPADASPGDHAGGVVAQLDSMAISSSGQRLQLLQRVAARIFVRVTGPLHPELAVEHLRAAYTGTLDPTATGRTKVDFVVHNTGNVKLGGVVTVSINGHLGRTERIALPVLPLLIPGTTVTESTTIPGVYPEGRLTATVSIDAVALPGDVDPGRPPTLASVTFWAVPLTLLIVAVVLIVVVGALAAATAAGLGFTERLRPRSKGSRGRKRSSASHARQVRPPSHARS